MRRLLLVSLASLTLACAGPAGPRVGTKEIYVEPYLVDTASVTAWPLAVEAEEGCYTALRSLATGRFEGQRKLAILVDQWNPPRAAPGEGVAAIPSEVVIDSSVFPNGVPDTLFYPGSNELQQASLVYVGHAVFRGNPWSDSGSLTHHLRFFVVNREPTPIRLEAKDVALALAANEDAAIRASRFAFLTAANHRGEAVRALTVASGESGLLHVFFKASSKDRSLHLRWQLREAEFAAIGQGLGLDEDAPTAPVAPPGPGPSEPGAGSSQAAPGALPPPTRPLPGHLDGGPDAPSGPPLDAERLKSWKFHAVLVRRYVLREGVISRLEQRAANEEPLPEPVEGDYTEPRVTPLAPR